MKRAPDNNVRSIAQLENDRNRSERQKAFQHQRLQNENIVLAFLVRNPKSSAEDIWKGANVAVSGIKPRFLTWERRPDGVVVYSLNREKWNKFVNNKLPEYGHGQ